MNINVGILQMNPQIGSIEDNASTIIEGINKAENDVDLLVTPEMSIIGYPPMDILRRESLYAVQDEQLEKIENKTVGKDIYVIVGFCRRDSDGIYNSVMVIHEGERVAEYDKQLLPTYDVFDGHRYFKTGREQEYFTINNEKIALSVCEDAWSDTQIMCMKVHDYDPYDHLEEDTDIIINVSASPFSVGKNDRRVKLFSRHAKNTGATIILCNQVGANDELVFDGNSFVIDPEDNASTTEAFDDGLYIVDELKDSQEELRAPDKTYSMKRAVITGIEDYFRKTGFNKAIVGMSGGIDSSVATALTADALGNENVLGVTLPSSITSGRSVRDARNVASNLGIEFSEIPIAETVEQIQDSFENNSEYSFSPIARENIQAKIRGDILMSLSNSTDSLVITPDNKSESAVGYCTLYGDTVGAIAPLGDCYKHQVYSIAETYSEIPQTVIERPPSAELKENQKDSDDISEYNKLDEVLSQYVEENRKPDEISVDDVSVENIIDRLHNAEFKRNQSPLPIRVTDKDFGRGWRYPITGDYDFLK